MDQNIFVRIQRSWGRNKDVFFPSSLCVRDKLVRTVFWFRLAATLSMSMANSVISRLNASIVSCLNAFESQDVVVQFSTVVYACSNSRESTSQVVGPVSARQPLVLLPFNRPMLTRSTCRSARDIDFSKLPTLSWAFRSDLQGLPHYRRTTCVFHYFAWLLTCPCLQPASDDPFPIARRLCMLQSLFRGRNLLAANIVVPHRTCNEQQGPAPISQVHILSNPMLPEM
jgi:hypothetical protein